MPKKVNVGLNTPIVRLDKNIIGKTVKELEKKYHIKFKKVNWKKPNPNYKLQAGDQIEICGANHDIYSFGK